MAAVCAVVADASTVLIQDANKDVWSCKTVKFNAPHDLAQIKITNKTAEGKKVELSFNGRPVGLELTPAGAMETGDTVVAFGNNMGLGLAVTAGIVSAIGKQVVELDDDSTIELPILQVGHGLQLQSLWRIPTAAVS